MEFFIVTPLDASSCSNCICKSIIIIDEPELSLHPSLQRKMANLIYDYAKDRQIIISTHSPFFIDWNILSSGAELSRTVQVNDTNSIHHLSKKSIIGVGSLLKNFNNPHIFGLNANEVFFLEDNIVLVEGQEDVIFFQRIMQLLGIETNVPFFGWGAGGASNIDKILNVLQDIGFKKITIILDNNVEEIRQNLADQFPLYNIEVIPTDDIRDKPKVEAREGKEGLIDRGGKNIKEQYVQFLNEMFKNICNYHQ